MAKERLVKTTDIGSTVRAIDFVSRFQQTWKALTDIIGVSNVIRKANGTILKSLHVTMNLQNSVGEGEEIPYSKPVYTETNYSDVTIEKYSHGVSLEAISKYGYNVAVTRADNAFLFALQNKVTKRFYDYLKTGELTNVQTGFQAALAYAKGLVENRFQTIRIDIPNGVVGFVNTMDVTKYLATANITLQTQNGFQYIKDFLGYNTIFVLGDNDIPRGTVIALPADDMALYYVDPSDSEFAQAGLAFETVGDTNLIGLHIEGDYKHAVSESFAILGLALFAEYIDGIAVVKIEASGALGSITVTSAAGTDTGDSKVKAAVTTIPGEKLYYKDLGSADAPAYLDEVDLTGWTAIEANKDVNIAGLTASNTLTVIGVNGSGQAIDKGTATIVVKT